MIEEILSGDEVAVDNSASEITVEVETESAEKPENQEENNANGEVKKKRPSGFHRKISKLEQQNAELAAQLAKLSQSATLDVKKPTLDDYQTYDDYVEALTEYKAAEIINRRDSEAAAKKEKEELAVKQKEVEQSWEDKIDALDESYDDFDEVMAKHQNTLFRQDLIQAIRESDHGPQVQYHLAKNPDLLNKLNAKTISSFGIYKEISKIESELGNLKKPAAKVSKSSEPITPVKGMTKTAPKLENLDTHSYIAHRYPDLYKKR
jgi:hypothetical protein